MMQPPLDIPVDLKGIHAESGVSFWSIKMCIWPGSFLDIITNMPSHDGPVSGFDWIQEANFRFGLQPNGAFIDTKISNLNESSKVEQE